MKIKSCVFLASLLCSIAAAEGSQDAVQLLETSPLRFQPASTADDGRFIAAGLRYRFEFQGNQARFRAGDRSVQMHFSGADAAASVTPVDRLRSVSNVFVGNDRSKWRTNIPEYARLRVNSLYNGIDLIYYGTAGSLEYDLVVKPGADPAQVRLQFTGERARLDHDGNLIAGFIEKRPLVYQTDATGNRLVIQSRYRSNADGTFSFKLGRYNRARSLVIDPVLTFSSYLGASQADVARSIWHDSKGLLYVGGTTYSSDFPMTGNSADTTPGALDVFLAILDPTQPAGSQLVYTTFFGGAKLTTLQDMTVGPTGLIYITGQTNSTDLPMANAAQTVLGGTSDAYVSVIDPSQSGTAGIVYSTFLGGSSDDLGTGIAIDPAGKIYVSGSTVSSNFPTVNPLQIASGGAQDVFVAEYDTSQSGSGSLIYSTYLGGSDWDISGGITVAKDGTVWVTGGSVSGNFPTTGNARQQSNLGSEDMFVTRLNPSLGANSLLYSTYVGGAGLEQGTRIVTDSSGRAVVAGFTTSPDFPVTAGTALQPGFGGDTDAVVVIVDPNGTFGTQFAYSTFFGGSSGDAAYDIKLDAAGNIYLTGYTFSTDMPVSSNAIQPTFNGGTDAYLVKFSPSKSGLGAIAYSSYIQSDGAQLGYGLDIDAAGRVYVVGWTTGPLLEGMGGATKTTGAGNTDGFVAGFDLSSSSTSTTSVTEVPRRRNHSR